MSEAGQELAHATEEIADTVIGRIRASVPAYRALAGSGAEEFRQSIRSHVRFALAALESAAVLDVPDTREEGRRSAEGGIPFAAVLAACQVVADCLWERLSAAGTPLPSAARMWTGLQTCVRQLALGYQEESLHQARADEQRRTALLDALLAGRLDGEDLSQAADVLRIPARGTYAVIAAQVPAIGRNALLRAETTLQASGAASVWRLGPDLEVGVACLSISHVQPGELAELLHGHCAGPVAVSPAYHDLRESAAALRLVTEDLRRASADPLAAAIAAAPDVLARVAEVVFAELAGLPVAERALLLDTFGAWLACHGSVVDTAGSLNCHPNTVWSRLRKLEERTGRSLTDPRQLAELSLAYRITRENQFP
ncbi:PucR family transcriptional regulator [Crossiella cryophila]|uniref:PucR family transcriptional regulator n=1 Tax=Crossiella cryophila TaxID=43355 RepID=A0A7W7CC48_9PSEU|nr:helix-turn-helix domain-containing protein [Crossiella cryophila]MBB4678389.1 hypothetical protein [Crossiella cryophila]